MKIFPIILILPYCFLQGGSLIRGQVIDGNNQLPLSQANISVVNTEMGTTTDENGEFLIEISDGGYYSILVTYIGYEPKVSTDIWVRPNANDFQQITLYPSVIEMDNVVVTQNYFEKNSLHNYSSITFKNDQIRRAPGAGSEVTRILNSLPSVASVGENRQDIMVRGGGPNENGFLIDNIYIPNISHFSQPDGRSNGPVGLINTELVENLDFYSNGFSAEYGNKLSSYGDITYREGSKNSFEGSIGIGLGGAGGVFEGPVNDEITFLSSFRMSYLDILSDAINAGGLPSYNDYQGKINYKPNQYHSFTFLGIFGNSIYERNKNDATSVNEDSYGAVKNNQSTLGINHRYVWNKKAYSNNSISFSDQISKIEFFDVLSDSFLNGINDNYFTSHLRNVNYISLSNKLNIVSGFEMHNRDLTYDFKLNDILIIDDVVFKNLCLFFNLKSMLTENLAISMGARLENSDFENTFNMSPRVNIDYSLPRRMGNIILNSGSYYQNPPEKYLTLETEQKLRSVNARQSSISYEKLFTESTKFSFSIYEKQYSNAPMIDGEFDRSFSPAFLMDRNITFNNIISNGTAKSTGVEMLIEKKRAENFYGHIGGSLFNSTYMDYAGVERNRDSNYKYLFNAVGGYRPNDKWEISFRWSLFGGKPYTEIDVDKSLITDGAIYFTEEYNEGRTPVYHNLFLRYEYRKIYQKYNMIGYIELWNAYNRKNIETYSWSSSAKKIIETTYFSFIPVGGFEIEF